MKQVRRSVVLAGVAALGLSSACVTGGDASTTRADSTVVGRDSAATNGSTAGPAPTVATAPAASPPTGAISVATGVYTIDQAAHGSEVYTSSCAQCHTMAQHSGTRFAAAWNNRRLSDLYEIVHNTMPVDSPGGLTDEEYIDVIAYMLRLNAVPAGKTPLEPDVAALRGMWIDVKPLVR